MKIEFVQLHKVENCGTKYRVVVEFETDQMSPPDSSWTRYFSELVEGEPWPMKQVGTTTK